LEINKRMAGRPRTVQTPDLEEAVKDTIEEKPSSSTHTTLRDLQIHHSTVWRVLKEQQLHPFHLQKVQALTAEDYPRRSVFVGGISTKLL
jgi:IS30 family transposase